MPRSSRKPTPAVAKPNPRGTRKKPIENDVSQAVLEFDGHELEGRRNPIVHNEADARSYFLRFANRFYNDAAACAKDLGMKATLPGTLRLKVELVGEGPPKWESSIVKWLFLASSKALREHSVWCSTSELPPGIEVSASFATARKANVKEVEIQGEIGQSRNQIKSEPCLDKVTETDLDPLPFKDIPTATQKLRSAVDDAVAAFNGNGDINASCESFTRAARSFAALILAERVRQSFEGIVDGESNESLDDKQQHSEAVRKWLAEWNLAFQSPSSSKTSQLFGRENRSKAGAYVLIDHGGSRKQHAEWGYVKSVLAAPTLGSATQIHRR